MTTRELHAERPELDGTAQDAVSRVNRVQDRVNGLLAKIDDSGTLDSRRKRESGYARDSKPCSSSANSHAAPSQILELEPVSALDSVVSQDRAQMPQDVNIQLQGKAVALGEAAREMTGPRFIGYPHEAHAIGPAGANLASTAVSPQAFRPLPTTVISLDRVQAETGKVGQEGASEGWVEFAQDDDEVSVQDDDLIKSKCLKACGFGQVHQQEVKVNGADAQISAKENESQTIMTAGRNDGLPHVSGHTHLGAHFAQATAANAQVRMSLPPAAVSKPSGFDQTRPSMIIPTLTVSREFVH